MDHTELQGMLDVTFDQALVHHGFVDYMRDYEMIVYCTSDPRTGITPKHERLLFKNCVVASVETALPASTWSTSLDDRLIDYATGVDLDGYVWGVKWQCLYPGAQIVKHSEIAAKWSSALGVEFHQVHIETNAHDLTLVFSHLTLEAVEPGYTPYTVGPDGEGPNFKIPLS